MSRKNTSIEVEQSDLDALKAIKKKTGASISAQAQIAIHEYVDSRRKMGLLDLQPTAVNTKRSKAAKA